MQQNLDQAASDGGAGKIACGKIAPCDCQKGLHCRFQLRGKAAVQNEPTRAELFALEIAGPAADLLS
jgi:hypothetical protein